MQELNESRYRIILAHEETRKEVANLLHGRVQSRLLVLGYWLGECQELLKDGPQDVSERLGNARSMLVEIIEQDLRAITSQLYPAIIHVGLSAALRSLAERFQRIFDAEIEIDEDVAEIEGSISPGFNNNLRLTLYRVVEEALTNVAKYSQADRVRICLGLCSSEELYLRIQDNGQGFEPAESAPGHGLLTMGEYADGLGGRLELDSSPGWGTTVRVWLPIANRVKALAKS